MRKTTVYLTDEESDGLYHLAALTGRSQSELIREGVRKILARKPVRRFHSLGVAASDGTRPRWTPDEVHRKTRGER